MSTVELNVGAQNKLLSVKQKSKPSNDFSKSLHCIGGAVRLLRIVYVIGISLMDSVIVHPEVAPVGEPLAALVAGERPFPHVNVPLVSPQVPAASKTLATLRAAEGPLPCVRAGVHSELRGREEALVAELAGMQSHSGVPQEVPALMRRVGEALGAVRTRVRPPAAPARSGDVAQVVAVSQGE